MDIANFAAHHRRIMALDSPRPETWRRDTDRYSASSANFMAEYQTRFAVPAAFTFDRLTALGARADQMGPLAATREMCEDPTNPLGVEAVARTLGVMSAQVEQKHLR